MKGSPSGVSPSARASTSPGCSSAGSRAAAMKASRTSGWSARLWGSTAMEARWPPVAEHK